MTMRGFRPTHVVPAHGLPSWESPDPDRPTLPLDPLLPVELVERRGDWGHVRCANGWAAWVDSRRLVAVPVDPPSADDTLAAEEADGPVDPRPLLARAERALAGYRAAVEELAAGTLDGEAFGDRTRGLRIGIVIDGEAMWLYDPVEERWVYGDGRRLSTYATDRPVTEADDRGHAPTEVVTPGSER
ncbi:hypothetical protein [Streptomyces sp. AF1A]|jgi:hypothetical protein|uniref:hypothetical protein n=1 Tax=Streptomyces sp. AF1A TaxID=3394350 RepID=UPI0039BC764A